MTTLPQRPADTSAASDETIRLPLWEFTPALRLAVIHERRKRFQNVDEEIGDPEYS